MKPAERGEVLGLAKDEKVRDPFRAPVIEEKKRRRVRLGDDATWTGTAERALRGVLDWERRAADVTADLVVEHPRYAAAARLPPEVAQSPAEDLAA